MRTPDLIFAKPRPISQVEARPYRYAALVGAGIGVLSAGLGVVAASVLMSLLPREIAGKSAADFISAMSGAAVLLWGVFLIPLWETFIAQLLPLELARKIGFNDTACILVGTLLFGAGHYLNGGLGHGLCALISGALFSTGYMTMRPWGYLPAVWASYIAHALNNSLFLYAVPLAFPRLT